MQVDESSSEESEEEVRYFCLPFICVFIYRIGGGVLYSRLPRIARGQEILSGVLSSQVGFV